MNPLVSIIIPCFNCEEYVGEAVGSALSQTYDRIEIIVVDDGSSDSSPGVVSEISAQHPDIVKLIRKNHCGAPTARNTGVEHCSGDYLLFLDADDLLVRDAVSSLMNPVLGDSAEIVVGDWMNIYEGSDEEDYVKSEIYFPGDPLASFIKHSYHGSVVLVKKSPIIWNTDLNVNQVVDYFFNAFLRFPHVAFLNRLVSKVRQHSSPSRVTNHYDHWEPGVCLELYTGFKAELESSGMLTFPREAALDEKILAYLYEAKRGGLDCYQNYVDSLNTQRIKDYYWYKPWGVSGFVYRLGAKRGIEFFYGLNRALGRV